MANKHRTVGLSFLLMMALLYQGCQQQAPQQAQPGQPVPQASASQQTQTPQAEFTAQPNTGDAPLKVQFTDQSLKDPRSWSWDFGDGSKSAEQSPSHEYTKTGAFSVTLKVSNDAGFHELTKQSLVNVSPGPIARIQLNPQIVNIAAGETTAFSARAFDSAGNEISGIQFSWKATGGEIDSQGLFKAGNKASSFASTITARAEYKSASKDSSASVNITPGPPAKIILEPTTATVKAGENLTFKASALDRFGNIVDRQQLAWRLAAGGGELSAEGRFTAGGKQGTYSDTVTVTLAGTGGIEAAKATLTATPGAIDRVEVSPASASLNINGKQQFQARALDRFANEISQAKLEWQSDPAKGQLSNNGLFSAGTVAGKFENLVRVTASAEGKTTTGAATVTIAPGPMARLSIDPDKVTLRIGGKQTFKAVLTDSFGNPLAQSDATWSLKASVGEMDKNGVFLAGNRAGVFKDTIQARVVDKETVLTALSTVTILADPLDRLEITPKSVSVGFGITQQLAAIATDQFGNKLSDVSFVWSVKDGGNLDNKQVFTAGEKPGNFADAVRVEARQGTISKVAIASITVEPDRIAFLSNRDKAYNVYVMERDGSNVTRITSKTDTSETMEDLAWSPDGQRFLYQRGRPDPNKSGSTVYAVLVVNADGSGEKDITGGFYPSWSPDGKKIVIVSTRDGNSEIYVMDSDGSNQTRITNDPAVDFLPSWSPDGKKIAFTSKRDGNYEIYLMDTDGRNVNRLTRTMSGKSSGLPRWSPDGRKIAFESDLDGDWEIFVINSDGSNLTQLTSNSFNERTPSWSPDGKQIVFASNREGNYEIYVMDSEGRNQIRLTDNSAIDWYPVFAPRKKGVRVEVTVSTTPTLASLATGSSEEAVALVKPSVVRLTSAAGEGSGFVIDSNGLVLTNNHVVENVQTLTVQFDDGRTFSGTVLNRDFLLDLAVVKINITGLTPVVFGAPEQLKLGETLFVLGFPGGLKGSVTVTSGRFSAARKDEKQNITWVQTDTAINPGNSGGPVINSKGEVVGIVTKKQVTVGGIPAEGLGFAISAQNVQDALPRLRSG